MKSIIITSLFILFASLMTVNCFNIKTNSILKRNKQIKMEYIPDGMSKAQWEQLKKKEAEANKGKNLGAIGITKFKSRSFEAFQKSGAKNLFPVAPDTPIEQRPYMQRPGGMPDGSDLKKKGIFGIGQGVGTKRTQVDDKYEKLEKEGKLKSSPWADSLPWTNQAASTYKTPLAVEKAKKAAEDKKANIKSNAKPGSSDKTKSNLPVPEEKPKKFFGLF